MVVTHCVTLVCVLVLLDILEILILDVDWNAVLMGNVLQLAPVREVNASIRAQVPVGLMQYVRLIIIYHRVLVHQTPLEILLISAMKFLKVKPITF